MPWSVLLIHEDKLVGAINVNKTSPGRVLTAREQAILEWPAPQTPLVLDAHDLTRDLH